jgi:hypothetical protein
MLSPFGRSDKGICLVKSGVSHRDHFKQSCSIHISGPRGLLANLRLLPLLRNGYDIGFGATAIILIEASDNASPRYLAPGIAVLLTPAEITFLSNCYMVGDRPRLPLAGGSLLKP